MKKLFKIGFLSLFFCFAIFAEEVPYLTRDAALDDWLALYYVDPLLALNKEKQTDPTLEKPVGFTSCKETKASFESFLKMRSVLPNDYLKDLDVILDIQSPVRLQSYLDKIRRKLIKENSDKIYRRFKERILSKRPEVIAGLDWYYEDEIASFDFLKDPQLKKGSCYRRSSYLSSQISANKLTLEQAKQAVNKVSRCYRLSPRAKFFTIMGPVFTKHFGESSKHWLAYKHAENAYKEDDYSDSIQQLKKLTATPNLSTDVLALANKILADNYLALGELKSSLMYQRNFIFHYKALDKALLKSYKDLVLISFDLGRFDEVVDLVDKVEQVFKGHPLGSNLDMFSFWRARSYYLLGQKSLARKQLQKLARQRFSGYYAALAQVILENNFDQSTQTLAKSKARFYPGWLEGSFVGVDKQRVQWIQKLIKGKMNSAANCEIEELLANTPRKVAAVGLLHYINQDFLSSVKSIASISRQERLQHLPVGFEKVLFPKKYSSTVEEYSKKLNVDPDFVFAIMRQESVFNPKALSRVGAVGLLQLMPSTARLEMRRIKDKSFKKNITKRLKRSRVRRNDLMKPIVNIGLGIHHIATLFEQFEHPVYVMTSYNAGPTATDRWIENIPTKDMLTFIEWVPYRETQLYIKLVFRNYFYYKFFYKDTDVHKPVLLDSMMKIAFDHSSKSSSVKPAKESL